jgi:hypothetical protein
MRTLGYLAASAAAVLLAAGGCGRDGGGAADLPDSVTPPPATPLEVGLEFSNALAMNDPVCYDFLVPAFRDSVAALGVPPWEVFGRWRGFDASGRLTEIVSDSTGARTSYYCTIVRMEHPAVVRIDFLLDGGRWLIEGFGEEIPGEVIDSLSVERTARMIMANPQIRFELRVARQLLDDCEFDSVSSWASAGAALGHGTGFPEYISALTPEAYEQLALSNIRRSARLQIIQDRATFNLQNVPVELTGFAASWRELGYIGKAVLRARHEAMQNLRSSGVWADPDPGLDLQRLAVLRSSFLAVSDCVEALDTLSTTYPALLTTGDEEPLDQLMIQLDPHVVEQISESDVGVTIWRALGVEMNGDQDPERVVYWAGNLFLFEGRPTGYRLVWRTYAGYDSDFHAEFSSQPGGLPGCREISLIGNGGAYEYALLYENGGPVFRRTPLGTAEVGAE